MDRLIAANTVPFGSHDVAPASGVPGLAREANQALGIPGTDFPAYAWNMLSEEIRNALLAAGLTPSGSDWTQLATALQVMGRRVLSFGTPGGFSWTVPPGVTRVRASVIGAGGGGCNSTNATPGAAYYSGGGGGSGGYGVGTYAVTPGQIITGVVGAGGAAQANGGASSFGTFCTATGGAGSNFNTSTVASAGGAPGSAFGGILINCNGGFGSDGQFGNFASFGNGAPGPFGGGGRAAGNFQGYPGQAPGAGGGGAYACAGYTLGGAGANGIVILEF